MIIGTPDNHQTPVSIADLVGHDCSVASNLSTEEVVEQFEIHPEWPGVLILDHGRFVGVITRLKLFERLGHRFGVELFMQKPITQLGDLIGIHTLPLPANLRIDEAIRLALGRPAKDVYDPVVVQHEDGRLQLLDINVLLLAQSRVVASMSNIVGNLEEIDAMISSRRDQQETFEKILNLLCHVVPYHQAAILAVDTNGMYFLASSGYRRVFERADRVMTSAVYEIMLRHRQALYIPTVRQVPAWQGMESLGEPLAWLGVPLLKGNRSLGLLSISRNVERAFTNEERETALAFSQRIIRMLEVESGANLRPLNPSKNNTNPNGQAGNQKESLGLRFATNPFMNDVVPSGAGD